MKLNGFIDLYKINLLKFLQSLCRLVGPPHPSPLPLGVRGPFHGCHRKRDAYPLKSGA